MYWLFLLLLLPLNSWANIHYQVEFEETHNKQLIENLKKISELINQQKNNPKTRTGLKRRAEGDLRRFSNYLESLAYYDAFIDLHIQYQNPNQALVIFTINEGHAYPIHQFTIEGTHLSLDKIGIQLNTPARTTTIKKAEEHILERMAKKGYPLAKIEQEEIIVDKTAKEVDILIKVSPGPQVHFGDTILFGNTNIDPLFFKKKISWKPGELFSPEAVEETQNALENSGLFRSITIHHTEELDPDGRLPMFIDIIEGNHHTLGLGINYATELGMGFTGEWEYRNIRNMGEKFNIITNLWSKTQEATFLYLIPDFLQRNQDFIWQAEFQKEHLEPYEESSFALSGSIENQLNKRLRFSYGAMFKELALKKTDHNHTYNLLKIPMYLRWNLTNNLLNPTQGTLIQIKLIPTTQLLSPSFTYCISRFTTSFYTPLIPKNTLTLAFKGNISLINGSSRRSIPTSERFFAGSDNTIRGYRYLTISPYDDTRDREKPTGGRSMLLSSIEARWRATETLGATLFMDAGNVYREPLPNLNERILKSWGIGFRYFTPVGPIRLDIAFPIDRRKKLEHKKGYIDAPFQIYLSVGQAF